MYLDYVVDIPDVKEKSHFEPKVRHIIFIMNTAVKVRSRPNSIQMGGYHRQVLPEDENKTRPNENFRNIFRG